MTVTLEQVIFEATRQDLGLNATETLRLLEAVNDSGGTLESLPRTVQIIKERQKSD